MIAPWITLLGPLAGPECLRASRRGWIIWIRLLPALLAAVVAFGLLWFWWMNQHADLSYSPINEVRGGLVAIEGLMVAVALILTPAFLAGSLAGEKERGSIGLLLTTRVNAFEIVAGRAAGRLAQVALIELAVLPALVLFAALRGFGPASGATLVLLPTAVALGAAGLSLAASALSKRGRDALLLVYLLIAVILISPVLDAAAGPSFALLSPFEAMNGLVASGSVESGLWTSAIWAGLGVVGVALAAWRLRPNSLRVGVEGKGRKPGRWRGWVPPIDRRPMLWKELYIERAGTLGRAGRWIGALLILWLGVGSLALAVMGGWGWWMGLAPEWSDWATGLIRGPMYGNSALLIGWLIQAIIGLRAAVAISSERERGTWDALLTSPLEGSEIIVGKLWGALYALRWLVGSAVVAWTVTFAFGGLLPSEYAERMLDLPIVGAFAAAVGVRTSLRAGTATRAMSITIGAWLGGYVVAKLASWIACVAVAATCMFGWILAIQFGLADIRSRPWFPMSFRLGSDLAFYGSMLIATVALVAETRLRFDRVAGRMTEGAAAVAVDRFLHGTPAARVSEKTGERILISNTK